ncbi:hypothetical protein H5410_061974 [Solanum commersonii]|uniref:Uncharacterized protein n=1 Tax=Solanum commersonii TaxID=4109 RepID=A0A9J5WAU6_SOLCO|nr:hypothetical protein H5410_061974 [Solanum commersonii]
MVFLRLVMGLSAKVVDQIRSRVYQGSSKESQTRLDTFASVQRSSQENQFNKWLVTTRCKECTYCLCYFIWPRRSHAFMFVQLRALFKSSVLIEIET